MQSPITQPLRTPKGIAFTVVVEFEGRECLVTDEALQKLSEHKNSEGQPLDSMKIFQAFEATINGVARRLIAAGVPGTPLMMNPNTFFRSGQD